MTKTQDTFVSLRLLGDIWVYKIGKMQNRGNVKTCNSSYVFPATLQ